MKVPKTQGFEGSGGHQGPQKGKACESFSPSTFLKIIKSYWEKGVFSPPLCVASEPTSSLPGTLGTVTVALRSLNDHPKKKLKLGSSNCLNFTEMVNSIIITLFCIILNIICDPITRSFFGAQSKHGVFVKTRYCTLYVCWQLYCKGKRIWMFAQTNWLTGLNYCRLSRTKMITMQLLCAYSENANQLCFRLENEIRKQRTNLGVPFNRFVFIIYTLSI